MNHSEKMKLFQEKKQHQLAMGGEKKLKARKGEGKLNARERIDCLFDPGTFMELGLFAHSALPGMADRTPARWTPPGWEAWLRSPQAWLFVGTVALMRYVETARPADEGGPGA